MRGFEPNSLRTWLLTVIVVALSSCDLVREVREFGRREGDRMVKGLRRNPLRSFHDERLPDPSPILAEARDRAASWSTVPRRIVTASEEATANLARQLHWIDLREPVRDFRDSLRAFLNQLVAGFRGSSAPTDRSRAVDPEADHSESRGSWLERLRWRFDH